MSAPALSLGLSAEALRALQNICSPQRTLTRYLERVAYASDASFYWLLPQAVVQPRSESEIQALFAWSQRFGVPLTFRAAGTSLSGQAVSEGLLVDLSKHWRELEVLEQGQLVRAQPGVIGGHLNRLLAAYGRKIGPDPASLQSCMLGGILANNASGMCCGVRHNAYHTLHSLRFMLPDGCSYDSGQPADQLRFEVEQAALCETLLNIREQILSQPEQVAEIRRKYAQKNTTGYGLNAFVDFAEPLEIFAHLLIGAEGTLAFIAEAQLQTLPDAPFKLTGLLFFASVAEACEHLPSLQAAGAAAIELMDEASLRSLPAEQWQLWLPQASVLPAGVCALLVEFQLASELARQELATELPLIWQTLPLLNQPQFSADPQAQAQIWKLRKGLYPSVGAVRQSGTSVIIEDVVFPPEHLATGVERLQALFVEHGYAGIIFGHARDANLHFVLTQSFATPADLQRYDGFMQALVALVLELKGALKAEHGTGRNVAPFVEAEWGPQAYQWMQQLKAAADPQGLLNPGVILNPSPQAHLQHLKALPTVDPEVDACTECGFCEPVCPSRRLSLTPRQRIVLRRELQRLQQAGASQQLKALQADYQYPGIETCAADGLCSVACPIGIDTGALIKRLRAEQVPAQLQRQVAVLSKGFGQLETGVKLALSGGHLAERMLGSKAMQKVVKGVARSTGMQLPDWQPGLPPANLKRLPETLASNAQAVYLPSCLSRNLGYQGQRDLPSTVLALAEQAGIALWIPPQAVGLCCGLPFTSKGFVQAGERSRRHLLNKCWAWTQHGHLPLIMDTSPCTQYLWAGLSEAPFNQLQVLDLVEFLARRVAPQLPLQQRFAEVVVHPVCSVRKMGLEADLLALAQRCAKKVVVPPSLNCCGYAGDRGLLYPELPAAALADVKQELADSPAELYCSSSRSCEMGLSLSLERDFVSIAHLLEAALV